MDARLENLRRAAREAVEATRAAHVAERVNFAPDKLARWLREAPLPREQGKGPNAT
jgi:hypothetical protein